MTGDELYEMILAEQANALKKSIYKDLYNGPVAKPNIVDGEVVDAHSVKEAKELTDGSDRS